MKSGRKEDVVTSTATEPSFSDGVLPENPRTGALRSAVLVAVSGGLTTLPFYVLLQHQQEQGRSAAALGMASMHMERMDVFWAFPTLQATGIAALIWSYAGVLLGLLESGRRPSWWRWSRGAMNRTHRHVSLVVLGLVLVHAIATAYDAMGDNWLTAFVPWQSSWTEAVPAYNLGIFALYFAVLLGPTYYLRRTVGPARWRFLHRFVLVVYVLSVWHTLLLGLDFSYYPWVRLVTWLAQIPLLALFARRLLQPGDSRGYAVRFGVGAAGVVAIPSILVLVLTGNSELPSGVGHHHHGHAMGHMSHDNPWMPMWLHVVASGVLVVVAVLHVRHAVRAPIKTQLWHAGHVLMALGMLAMFLPLHTMLIPAGLGIGLFGAAAVLALAVFGDDLVRGSRVSWSWLLAAVDFAAMVLMFAQPNVHWLVAVLVGWFVLQAAGWAFKRVDTGHGPALRSTLVASSLAMGYMFLVMFVGAPMAGM